ncbi:MAG: helicase-related protein [Methanocellales archaeon]|nr:helicase-related protein [Methanocellales archaeon]
MEYIAHPLIKPKKIEKRLYQSALAKTALERSSLIVLPTGLGKTIVALLVMADRLERCGGRVLVLSPTKPLVEQHAAFLRSSLNINPDEILVFTGELSPSKRRDLWSTRKVIVSTPQVIENDLIARRLRLDGVVHITFDEAHRAVGDYSYVYIAEKYMHQAKSPLILGITASPGASSDKIQEVCRNLHVEGVEIKTEFDPDVVPYTYEKEIEWRYVDVPDEIHKVKELIGGVLTDRINELKRAGVLGPKRKDISRRELLWFQDKLQRRLKRNPNPQLFKIVSLLAEIFKIKHAMDMIETQGVSALQKYFDRLRNEASSKGGSKAARRLVEEDNIKEAMHLVEGREEAHPKLEMVSQIVGEQLYKNPDSRIIVFTNFRDTAELVTRSLGRLSDVRPARFVGQASRFEDDGLSQRAQVEILQKFKSGKYNVLVATSVAEEGLDIPSTDLVLFYEPVPSEIRSIQRKGRTGRGKIGKVVVLVTKGTKDESYRWISMRKERSMYRKMKKMRELKKERKKGQKQLVDF